MRGLLLKLLLICCSALAGVCPAVAQEQASEPAPAQESFNAGELILDHVTDKHSWHICDWNGRKVELHLPVILLYNGELHTFSSARFENPQHTYKNFQLRKDNPHKGKIVALEAAEDGSLRIAAKKPLDFSITKTVFGLMVSVAIILILFFFIVRSYKKNEERAPKGVAALFEPIFLFVRDDVVYASLGKKQGDRFLPYMATLFFFILLGNLLGIVPFFPFGANVTGNISVTFVLAFLTYLITMAHSTKHFWAHTFNNPGVPMWMKFPLPLMPLIEAMELITKPFVLMIRLFANMTAGHIIILGFVSLVLIFGATSTAMGFVVSPLTILFGLFADALELLVSFIQAYIFTTLSCTYLADALGNPAAAEHHK
ncbi:MAG: F0F1 ATP synthase subunit A [Ruminococcus flavefaciens]|nr:F0F1 ATP synthase subunit A [Ruminococcus flavefaciens]